MNRPTVQLALLLLTRLWAITSLTIPGWSDYSEIVTSDMSLFRGWMEMLAAGQVPSGDLWQYPPGVSLVLWVLGETGLGVPGLLALILICDYVVFSLVRGTPGGALWAIAALLIGPLFLMRLDTVVTALGILGVVAGTHRVRGGIMLGVGGSMKLWPLMLAATYSRKESLLRGTIGLGAYLVVALTATRLIGNTPFVANQASRGLQVESVAAWPFMVARAMGADVDLVFQNGAYEIGEPLADVVSRALVPLSFALVAAIALRSWRSSRMPDPASTAPVALLLVATLLVTSRVLSPQFNIWLLGMTALVLATSGRTKRGSLVLLVCVTAVATQLLYPHLYANFLDRGVLGLSVQTIRLVALVAVLKALWSTREPLQTSASSQGRSFWRAGSGSSGQLS